MVTVAKDRADLARRQLKEIKAADDELRARAEKYRVGIIDRVGREIDEANAEKKGCLLEAQQRGDVGSRRPPRLAQRILRNNGRRLFGSAGQRACQGWQY